MLHRPLVCLQHGVVVQPVSFVRHNARFTHDFEDLVAWLVPRTDKTSVSTFARITWRTVGAICQRVVHDQLDDTRFWGLVPLVVDEISWNEHQHYLILISDHDSSTILLGADGKTAVVLRSDRPRQHSQHRGSQHGHGLAFITSVQHNAPYAAICIDPFHVVRLAATAPETVRRAYWQQARAYPTNLSLKSTTITGMPVKNPQNLTEK